MLRKSPGSSLFSEHRYGTRMTRMQATRIKNGFHKLKQNFEWSRSGRCISINSLVFKNIDCWYNTQGIHSALNGLTPWEAFCEKSLGACSDFGLRTTNFILKCVKIFAVGARLRLQILPSLKQNLLMLASKPKSEQALNPNQISKTVRRQSSIISLYCARYPPSTA